MDIRTYRRFGESCLILIANRVQFCFVDNIFRQAYLGNKSHKHH